MCNFVSLSPHLSPRGAVSRGGSVIEAWVAQLRGDDALRRLLNVWDGRIDFCFSVRLMAHRGQPVAGVGLMLDGGETQIFDNGGSASV